MIKRQITAEAALSRLQTLCSRAEMCTFEVQKKMKAWGLSASDAECVLNKLVEARYVDDERFAHAYVRQKFIANAWGRRKIAMQMQLLRLPKPLIAEALEEIEEEEYTAQLDSLVRARMRTFDNPLTYETRQKLFRSLVARGFEPSLVSAALRRAPNPNLP